MPPVFFNSGSYNKNNKQDDQTHFINIGGELFHALAVTLVDHVQANSAVSEPSLKKLLDQFFTYYPKAASNKTNLNSAERLLMLIKGSRKSELVERMAYVLRQIAVDEVYAEIYTHPTRYNELFEGLKADTSKNYLRQPDVTFPASALGALTRALGMKITLSYTQHGKELRKRAIYADNSVKGSNVPVVLQVQGEQYYPKVKDKTIFAYVGQVNHSSDLPEVKNEEGTISEYLEQITIANKNILNSYNRTNKILLNMVADNSLTKKNLIDFYIEFLPTDNTALDHGTYLISKLEQKDKELVPKGLGQSTNQQETKLLVDAMSGWVSTNQIADDVFFGRIDEFLDQNSKQNTSNRP